MTDTETICCGYGPSGRAFTVGGLENCCNGKCDYFSFLRMLIFLFTGNTYSKGDYDCCGGMYVFHKRFEKCLDPDCVDEECPELKEVRA